MKVKPVAEYDNAIFYKNRYSISFYDEDDETLIMTFDNVWEICKYKGMEINNKNVDTVRRAITRAMRNKDHSTEILTGKISHVYLVDMIEDIEEI